ncbi:MAG: tryptophan synthase subunit alpha [Deltaproteobacteria bacterium]|nr:tryptophan synthase subunit alpha [Deltaproteobacteria bacterium]
MSRIGQKFNALKQKKQSALIPFIMAGDPDLETTEALVYKLSESGADIIELGVPFSDPLADGTILQAASQRALQNGVSLRDIFDLTMRLKKLTTPIILMTYFNPVFRYGLKEFAAGCKQNQIDGVIIPDLPPEEAGLWIREARRMSLDTIFLIAQTSPPERIKRVNRISRGFIYFVSVTGVTGMREKLPEELESLVEPIREESRKPVAVGFGISNPEQAQRVGRFADGVIVGSAIVKIIAENIDSSSLVEKVGQFVSSFAEALRGRT